MGTLRRRIAIVVPLVAVLSACTWVRLSDAGRDVAVVSTAPSNCKRLGTSTSVTRASIASIDRRDAKVVGELETLARNAAGKMGGDTIVAETAISEEGEQSFVVYRCGD
ncbi:DUF4156 domain-containing protein [Pseudohaliea sp.]|uniref:DUF4156 domain-containing protein n=1 Tax=Pseudohaliea sp. TaxID=2740289 RepID=UPI0032EDE432